jgi:signal transduction histidine kinase
VHKTVANPPRTRARCDNRGSPGAAGLWKAEPVRVAVLPRDVAARVITSGIAHSAWAVNAMNLVLTIPILVEVMVAKGESDALPGPVLLLSLLVLLAVGAAIIPRPWVVLSFLVLCSAGAVLYEVTLLTVDPGMLESAFFVLNRPAVSLVLVGVASTTWLTGLGWTLGGYLFSTGASVAVAVITGLPLKTGWGPLLMLGLYVSAYLVLAAIQRSQRRRVPNFEQLEEETRRLAVEENMRSRVTAAVHDTLLNDLALVMNAPDELDERMTARLRADIATLTSAEWATESAQTVVDDQDSDLRNQIMVIMSDLQWRGLTVHVTGSGTGIYRLDPGVATALVDSIRACLENVLRHSGANVAEVDLAYTDDDLTVIVADQGQGFDPKAIPADRLGVRFSIVDRIRAVGGSTKIWSSPGTGTSIVIRVPVLEVVTAHEESRHGDE